jgi:predicted transcriptional regulator
MQYPINGIMDRAKIRNFLKRGDITLIAKMVGVTQSMVSQFFAGAKDSDKIFEAAIALAEQRKQEQQEKVNRIKAL